MKCLKWLNLRMPLRKCNSQGGCKSAARCWRLADLHTLHGEKHATFPLLLPPPPAANATLDQHFSGANCPSGKVAPNYKSFHDYVQVFSRAVQFPFSSSFWRAAASRLPLQRCWIAVNFVWMRWRSRRSGSCGAIDAGHLSSQWKPPPQLRRQSTWAYQAAGMFLGRQSRVQ